MGKTVTVAGVVTGRIKSGFFLQTPAGYEDEDDATSEGIFVYTKTFPEVVIGAVVQARGAVKEYTPWDVAKTALPTTEIVVTPSSSDYYTECLQLFPGAWVDAVLLSSAPGGRAIPSDAVYRGTAGCARLDLNQACQAGSCPELVPEASGIDFYESLEGMLVRFERPILSGFAERYGKLWVLANKGKDASTVTQFGTARLAVDGIPEACAVPGSPGILCSSDFNPEALRLNNALVDNDG